MFKLAIVVAVRRRAKRFAQAVMSEPDAFQHLAPAR
jgi:hypothetical protein